MKPIQRLRKSVGALRRALRRVGVPLPTVPPSSLWQLGRFVRRHAFAPAPAAAPRILMLTPRAWTTHIVIDGMLGAALSLRGARVAFAVCGGRREVCNITNVHNAPPMPCGSCHFAQRLSLVHAGFEVLRLADRVPAAEHARATAIVAATASADLTHVRFDGVPVGYLARIAARWFVVGDQIEGDLQRERSYRSFVVNAILTVIATRDLLDRWRPDTVFMLNGLFLEERVVYFMARARGISVVTYERAFHAGHFVFSRNQIACYYDLAAAWPEFAAVELSAVEQRWLDDYLADWRLGTRAHVKYWPQIESGHDVIRQQIGVCDNERIVTLFTNIVWDSAAQERDVAFPSMWEWIRATIALFADLDGARLIIRVHPAEVRLEGRETRDRVADRLLAQDSKLPGNVSVIGPESELSSYVLTEISDVVVAYTSTVGLEAAILGKRVVVAGQTHYRNKGFTWDPADAGEYRATLVELLDDASDDPATRIELARRYAHLFFYRYMYPLRCVSEPDFSLPRIAVDSPDGLAPGRDRALDVLCDFVLDARNHADGAALLRPEESERGPDRE